MDETYIKIKGVWHYLYRAVDKDGATIDFMLSKNRDEAAAKAFFIKAIGSNGLPGKITSSHIHHELVGASFLDCRNNLLLKVQDITQSIFGTSIAYLFKTKYASSSIKM